ncbi:MAG: S8 family serine peptidase, partial [Candidatus Omnitrophica bacterium]|nr:S8 family serine peptidase [Candidatus Omnitrophota bacterium]
MRRIPYIFPVFIFFCAFISWTPSWMSASLHAEVISNNQPQQLEVPAHVPNRIIVKFKDDADVGVVANQLKGTQQGFSAMTNNANLDKLSRKYKVKKVRKLFGDFSDQTYTATAGQISINQAQASRRTLKNKVRTAFEKTGKTHRNLSEERLDKITSFLDSTYVIEVDSDTDMYEVSRQFASDPNVEYAHPDYTMEIYYVPDDPYYHSYGSWSGDYDDLWGLKKINTEDAWDLTQGEGVVVAVVDTGLDLTHADIAENVWTNEGEIPGNGIDDDQNGYIDDVHGWDFGDQDNDVDDFQGHGTHVAGTIAAVGNNSEGIIGVAPKSKIMPVKGFSSYGGGTTSSLAAAIVYAAMNGADVISNSWGCNPQCPSDPVAEQAVKIAHDLGAVVVFAAGNSTKDVKLFSPQNMKETITVSATDRFDAKAGYSNFGLGVDVGAPGGGEADNILSLRASGTGFQHLVVGERYYRARGTSMATPHVSGLAALILSRHPEFTNEEVASIIKHTADDISDPGFDIQSGYGRINAYSAVQQDGPFLYDFSNVEVDMANQEIKVYGSVYHQDFNHYKIEYAPSMGETIPTEFLDFGVALENNGGQEVRNNLMATLDIQSLDSGQYYLRGTVELNDGSVKHFFTSFSLDKTMHEGWPIFLDDFVDRSPVITDLEGDGLNELIVSDMRTVYVLDDLGQNKEGWPVELEPSWNNGYSVSVGDLDNNGVNEVVVYGATKLYVFNADGSNYPGWPVSLSEPIPVHITSIGYPVIADLDQDGSSEIIISYLAGKVEVFNSDGTYYPGWPKTLKNEFNVDLYGFSPAVGDLDNDGDLEIVVAEQGGTDPKLYVFHHTGELLDGWPKSVGGIWFVPPVLGDIDQDGQLDIVAFSLERNPGEYVESNQLYVWHADGTLMDGWPYALGENRLLGMALADINHDGFPEIIT